MLENLSIERNFLRSHSGRFRVRCASLCGFFFLLFGRTGHLHATFMFKYLILSCSTQSTRISAWNRIEIAWKYTSKYLTINTKLENILTNFSSSYFHRFPFKEQQIVLETIHMIYMLHTTHSDGNQSSECGGFCFVLFGCCFSLLFIDKSRNR